MNSGRNAASRQGRIGTCLLLAGSLGLAAACAQTPREDEVGVDHEAVIRQYYEAYREKDQEALRATLTPDLRHVSEFGTHSDRDRMIEQIWPSVGRTWAEDLRIFGEPPEFMVRYRVVGGERPSRNMAEFLRFEGDRIAEIEVFMGREVE